MPDLKLSRRLAWLLVRAYPPRFRQDVGLGLVDTLDDRMRAARASGVARPVVWFRAVLDTIRNAPVEWMFAARDGLKTVPKKRTTMDTLWQDVRYALRLWRRKPVLAAVAVVTLALGIGANSAMFSIVNAVLLRPLPYPNADRLTSLWARTPVTPRSLVSYNEYQTFAAEHESFDAVGLWLGQSVNLTGTAEPQRLLGSFVSGSFFDVLQLRAERGRLFREEESSPEAAKPVVVISHAYWDRLFHSDPSAIGATLILNGSPLTVIGVLADPFDLHSVPGNGYYVAYDVYIPVGLFPTPSGVPLTTAKATPSMLAIARLKAGVSIAAANANLDVVTKRLEAADPKTQRGRSARVFLAQDDVVGDSRTPLLLLLASVGVVLLIACVNVSNLLVARAVDRQKEMAVRSALGASRGAVLRQLAIESLLLSLVAAASGLLLSRWTLSALTSFRPPNVPIPDTIPLDGAVLTFTIAVGVAAALVCGLAPALRITRADVSQVLQAGGRRSSGGGARTRDGLVVAEIALSVTLLAVSALIIQSMLALERVNIGFDNRSVFTLQFRLPQNKYATPESIAQFFQQAIAKIREVPGVESAALVRRVPFSGNWGDTPFTSEGHPVPAGSEPRAGQNIVTPDYFRSMRIQMISGRDFSDRDDLRTPPVVIVNETLVRTTWPGEDPLGKHISVPEFHQPMTVIGVVGDVKHRTATEPSQPQLYLAHYQLPMTFSSLVARTAVPPESLAAPIRRAVWTVDKDQPMWSVAPLERIVENSRGSTRFLAQLLAAFAGMAVLLAAVGIYGVMSYAVTERTHEIGIRMALGASGQRVRREIVARGFKMTAIALAIGVPGAVALGGAARAVLFGIGPGDPATLAAAGGLLALVSLAACYLPARRASRVDPVVALAQE